MTTKFVLMSDTHLQHGFEVPDGDVLIHSGDATWTGTEHEVKKFAEWYGFLPHKFKIFVAGNHDFGFQRWHLLFKHLLWDRRIMYLEDSEVEIEGFKIYGAPWQPEFNNWAFNLPRGEALRKIWSSIPDDTDILITHGPPQFVLDRTLPYENVTPSGIEFSPPRHVGCADLKRRIAELPKLKLHVFGHIHAGYGQEKIGNVLHVNASICNEKYKPINPPVVVEL